MTPTRRKIPTVRADLSLGSLFMFGLNPWTSYYWRCPSCQNRNSITNKELNAAKKCVVCDAPAIVKEYGFFSAVGTGVKRLTWLSLLPAILTFKAARKIVQAARKAEQDRNAQPVVEIDEEREEARQRRIRQLETRTRH